VSEERHLHDIRNGYTLWTGAPGRVIEFRRPEHDEIVPSTLDVLIFPAPEGPNEDDVTLLGTAGMSLRPMPGPDERIELVIEIKGTPDEETLNGLAKDLAELAVLPFREGRPFAPNIVLEGIEIDAFPRMRHALLANWAFVSTQYLPEVDCYSDSYRSFSQRSSTSKRLGTLLVSLRWWPTMSSSRTSTANRPGESRENARHDEQSGYAVRSAPLVRPRPNTLLPDRRRPAAGRRRIKPASGSTSSSI
jgi:hypothetical protein